MKEGHRFTQIDTDNKEKKKKKSVFLCVNLCPQEKIKEICVSLC